MKINKIAFYNIGPYIGRNVFDLSLNRKKNIVLIGGKNGAGKTTFFRSLKTCLYGSKVWGFDVPGREYFKIINGLININTQFDDTSKAYVEIDLSFDDGKQDVHYLLHREWKKERVSIAEYLYIEKDNRRIDDEEQIDFVNFLLSMIPPDMFNFYFFDGESIADYFLGDGGEKNFKNAFLKLYGLDTISIMIENFNRNLRRRDCNNIGFEQYNAAKLNIEHRENRICELKNKVRMYDLLINEYESKRDVLIQRYNHSGGISVDEWKEINLFIAKEESQRDEKNRYIKEIANHYLPFIIMRGKLNKLLLSIEKERQNNANFAVKERLMKNDFQRRLKAYLTEKKVDTNNVNEILDFICNNEIDEIDNRRIFDFSDSQINKIISQIYEKISFNDDEIVKITKDISRSLKRNKILKDKLSNSNIDGFEELTRSRNALENDIISANNGKEIIQKEIERHEELLIIDKQRFVKIKDEYERTLRTKAINDMSARAVAAYTLLEDKLIKKQGKILQEEFIKCFSSIINKENFVDGIVIDDKINVIPYKYTKVTFLQIDNYLKIEQQSKFLDLFDEDYKNKIIKMKNGKLKSVILPAPIMSPFSQGERQVYIMSLYLALLKTSKKDVPFFIDTPFARIDSTHRDRIVKEFFKGIPNQLFILSTDEEITGTYKQLIEDEISNEFLLEINDFGMTTVIANKYFEEA